LSTARQKSKVLFIRWVARSFEERKTPRSTLFRPMASALLRPMLINEI